MLLPITAEAVVRAALRGDELHDGHPSRRVVACASDPYADAEKYGALRAEIARKDWGGRAGAVERSRTARYGRRGIPDFHEMDLVRKQPGPDKYIVCNADESEPGTSQDRFIMNALPHLW